MNNKFIEEVTKHIKNKTAKQSIEDELTSHILDKIDYYVEIGYTKEQAQEKATEDMGDPEETAVPLNSLHNIKWYQKRENIVAIILNAILIIAVWCFHTPLLYDNSNLSLFSLIYSPVPFNAIHYLYIDLISFAFFILTVITINLAGKNRSKFIAVLTAGSVFIQIIFPPFQPMLYSVAKIITSGLNGYTNSVFSYAFIEENIKPILSIGSLVIALVLLLLCIYIFIGTYLKERGKATKHLWKPYKILKTILICFLSLNIILVSVCSTIAYVNIDEKIAKINQIKMREIEFVVNTPIVDKKIEELKKDVEQADLNPLTAKAYANYQSYNDSSYITAYCEPGSNVEILTFTVTTSSKLATINKDIYLSESEFDKYKDIMNTQDNEDNILKSYSNNTDTLALWLLSLTKPELTLSNFMDSELYQKALTVDKTSQTDENGNEYEDLRFSFALESDEYRSVTLVFKNNLLAGLQFWKK